MPRLTGPKPRAACFQSVDRAVDRSMPWSTGRSTGLSGRPGGRPTFSTGRPCGRPGANLACFNAPSCSFVFRSLCYLPMSPLSPLSLHPNTPDIPPSYLVYTLLISLMCKIVGMKSRFSLVFIFLMDMTTLQWNNIGCYNLRKHCRCN